MRLSLRKKISGLIPKIDLANIYHNNKRKTSINYRINIKSNTIKNKGFTSPSIKTEINYYNYISPKINFGYNTEKTEYSSQINDYASKIKGKSKIRPLFTNIKIFDNISQMKKTESTKFDSGYSNIFNNNKVKKNPTNNIQTNSCWHKKIDDFNEINKIDMENVIKFSNNFFQSKTPKKKKRKKYFPINTKNNIVNNRFNSLNCFIDNYIQIDEDKLWNRYFPKYEDYLNKMDCNKLIMKEKEKKLLTTKEKIKNVFKDTKLIMAMCDYLNSSFSKLKNKKRIKLKTISHEIEEIKKNKKNNKSIEENKRNNLISKNELFKMNNKLKKVFQKKDSMIYKNGYFSKSFFFPTSLSYNQF